ncbi:MAG TPA: hypothetical protein VFC15_04340 [Candidatus Limnocylindrales bacterium]|nr:hypothetical protein [Candidatus Limnocylindrales bacterium]
MSVMKSVRTLGWIVVLALAPWTHAQVQIGDNTHVNAGGLFTVGYAGDYGNQIQSSHGLQFGASGTMSGYYYNPNFVNFNVTPYYNQSKADSDYQSLTNASGVAATANFFTGSHFPGSVTYRYDYNSTGTLGLSGVPNFTTQGNGQGFGINWSALLPDLPTLTVGYQQGNGSSTLYGTNQESSSDQRLFNVRSSYRLEGFNINAFYDHTTLNSVYPEFLTGVGQEINDSSGQDFGVNTSRNLAWMNGSMYASYSHSSYSTDYGTSGQSSTNSGYTADLESAGVNFHPTQKFSFYANENFTNNLSAYFNPALVSGGVVTPPVNLLGSGSDSLTAGGGANYQFTGHLNGNAQATYYSQSYFGQTYTGTYLSGNVNYGRKLLNMFTFSAGVVDSSTGLGNNNIGFIGTVNYFRRFGGWETSGSFNYAQNVQSLLITETTSYYNYNANIHRKFSSRVQWTAAFNGSRQGLSSNKNSSSSSEGFATSLSLRQVALSAQYLTGTGNSILTSNGLTPLPPLPGVTPENVIAYNAKSYGGSVSFTPVRRMVLSGTYSRSLSDTLSNGIFSKNNTEIIYSQLQYRLRRISLLAGYSRFTQGISATGVPPGTVTSYYGGISRWFDFF